MAFFPEEIQTESVSRYTKLEKGSTKLRLIGEPIFGYETWLEEGDSRVPKRFKLDEAFEQSDLGADGVSQFMASKVYNYNAKSIQIWQFTQKTIMKPLKASSENPEFGDPTGYDIVITKEGEGKLTRYSFTANPPKDAIKAVLEASKATQIELDQLFINGDPFLKE